MLKKELDPFRHLIARWRQRLVTCFVCNELRMAGESRPPCERCTIVLNMIKQLEDLVYQLNAM